MLIVKTSCREAVFRNTVEGGQGKMDEVSVFCRPALLFPA